ncbi:type VI secretion system protein ImpA [Pararobbsia alpina]|uniref:type VI secretion system protein TssA n=1 Tax=Pararobbsia alpina TaxID=621374 RepID=UPI0039A4D6F3
MNVSTLLDPIDDAAPAGRNLEYDAAFTELERLATPTTERAMGESLRAAQEPDWDNVVNAAQALFTQTKDLRVAMHLGNAWTRQHGLKGWNATLELVRALLERYWDVVHPQLDPDDDLDPTARVNALMPLADVRDVLGAFRVSPFVQSPRMGHFSLRDLRVATGAIQAAASADGTPPPTLIDLEACCMDCSEEQLPETAAVLALARDHAAAIDLMLKDRLGAASPDLSAMNADLAELKKFVDGQCARRFPQTAEASPEDSGAAAASAHTQTQATSQPGNGKISGPDDVIRRLDDICEYYARFEPSSPLPILLQRARRLVGKSFAEVLRNIAPAGMSELETLAGPEDA